MHLKPYWQVHAFLLHTWLSTFLFAGLISLLMVPTPFLLGLVSVPSTMGTHGVNLAAVRPRCWAPVVIFQQQHLGVWLAFYLAYVVCHGGCRKSELGTRFISSVGLSCSYKMSFPIYSHLVLYSYLQQYIWIRNWSEILSKSPTHLTFSWLSFLTFLHNYMLHIFYLHFVVVYSLWFLFPPWMGKCNKMIQWLSHVCRSHFSMIGPLGLQFSLGFKF